MTKDEFRAALDAVHRQEIPQPLGREMAEVIRDAPADMDEVACLLAIQYELNADLLEALKTAKQKTVSLEEEIASAPHKRTMGAARVRLMQEVLGVRLTIQNAIAKTESSQ